MPWRSVLSQGSIQSFLSAQTDCSVMTLVEMHGITIGHREVADSAILAATV